MAHLLLVHLGLLRVVHHLHVATKHRRGSVSPHAALNTVSAWSGTQIWDTSSRAATAAGVPNWSPGPRSAAPHLARCVQMRGPLLQLLDLRGRLLQLPRAVLGRVPVIRAGQLLGAQLLPKLLDRDLHLLGVLQLLVELPLQALLLLLDHRTPRRQLHQLPTRGDAVTPRRLAARLQADRTVRSQ